MANIKFDKDEGVWRTIGGRRVFIRTGKNLPQAMKESGKFKSAKRVKKSDEELKKEIGNDIEKLQKYASEEGILPSELQDRLGIKDSDLGLKDKYTEKFEQEMQGMERYLKAEEAKKNTLQKTSNSNPRNAVKYYLEKGEFNKANEYIKEYGLEDERDSFLENLNYKIRSDYKKHNQEYELYKKAKERPNEIDPMTENSTDWEALDRKYKEYYKKENIGSPLNSSLKGLNKIDSIAGDDEKLQTLGRKIGANSLVKYRDAWEKYRKEHPNSKIDLYRFIKMNEE